MADQSHLEILQQGVESWNQWRKRDPSIKPDLSEADLSSANLSEANLSRANFVVANLRRADLVGANLVGANLSEANLSGAILTRADLSGADLSGADLSRTSLIEANLERATLEGCRIYGISAWNLNLEGAKQQNLNISNGRTAEPAIIVDNLEVAQFIYLLLNSEKIRQVIDTITSKVVLILGRFTSERKAVLEAIRDSLRQRNYLPVLLDLEGPTSRDLAETISTLAHMARFIIVDLTEIRGIPQEFFQPLSRICHQCRCSHCCWLPMANTPCSRTSHATLGC